MAGRPQARTRQLYYEAGPASTPPITGPADPAAPHPRPCYCLACVGRPLGDVHFYYPSMTIACGIPDAGLLSPELTMTRAEITCPGCAAKVEADLLICAHCRGDRRLDHTCDPVELGPPWN